ncbi:guanylate kinase [Candidatus Kuenenbacteria bacterium HGW-Kuenenbacteria-1]|uniref:Guanylate kinase n=1 Tax=Candidatus Kuenenbacteria bacterium HGW-Kuenenbacteria-1 TaxID=2013812 RepID=A0A2N1UNR2_9BACT|nr:MAG: guanylate kinase [Candidatus Kuenenbacteria bacterium HGW-Kuenenbacteria-1]
MLFIISGPSGVGKTFIIRKIIKSDPCLDNIIPCTTREKRPNEKHGQDYFFLSEEKFKEKIKNKEFLEWAIVHNNYYGTLKKEVENAKKSLILNIDFQGALQIKKKKIQAIFIFIKPESLDKLSSRIKKRGELKKEDLEIRLKNAKNEIKQATKHYDYVVINRENKSNQTIKKILQIIKHNS